MGDWFVRGQENLLFLDRVTPMVEEMKYGLPKYSKKGAKHRGSQKHLVQPHK